jgi:hypothetical protein
MTAETANIVDLRRGFRRLGIGLAVLWFVFWTCAYIIRPSASENAPSLPSALSLTTDIALMVAALLGMPWIVSGFRPN